LIQNPDIDEFDTYMNETRPINPKDNHISFQVKINMENAKYTTMFVV